MEVVAKMLPQNVQLPSKNARIKNGIMSSISGWVQSPIKVCLLQNRNQKRLVFLTITISKAAWKILFSAEIAYQNVGCQNFIEIVRQTNKILDRLYIDFEEPLEKYVEDRRKLLRILCLHLRKMCCVGPNYFSTFVCNRYDEL